MNRITFQHTVSKEQEGRYYTIDFEVPENVESFTVSYSYKRLNKSGKGMANKLNVVDLGLMDADNRFLGWSGGARSSVTIGEYASTKGYLTTPIHPGCWKILVGAYRIAPEEVEVTYTVEFAEKAPRWMFGDLHVHSDASDGQHPLSTLAARAQKMGLDFLAISNHNNYSENIGLPVFSGVTLLPAVEWTHYRGHMNFFGAEVPFAGSFVANSEGEMLTLIAEAKARGALISVNHPKCNLCPYLWESDTSFDLMEVWNGPMRPVNRAAIAWWDSLLRKGRRIPIVGGSDFHKDRHAARMGHPVTAVYAQSPAPADILKAIGDGKGYITSSIKGPRLWIKCGEAGFGETATRQDAEIRFGADRMGFGMTLELVSEKNPPLIVRRSRRTAAGAVSADPGSFAYLVVRRKILFWNRICAISNPVYFVD